MGRQKYTYHKLCQLFLNFVHSIHSPHRDLKIGFPILKGVSVKTEDNRNAEPY